MDKARHKRNYDLHAWSGVTLGIFLYIVCFTGAVAVFATGETYVWEDPANRIALPSEPAPITETFDAWYAEQTQRGEVELLGLSWPTQTTPYYQAYADIHLHGGDEHEHGHEHEGEHDEDHAHEEAHVHAWVEQRWHPETLAPLGTRQASMSEWLVDFHIYLKWPTMLGGYGVGSFIVGLAGILLLLSIITGVVAHTKMREEAFSLRFDKSVRLKWQDSHKVIGLWGAPFHVMIGFTGAFLGIIATMTPIVAFLAFQGNTTALLAAVEGEHQAASGVQAQMISLEEVRAFTRPGSDQSPYSVEIEHYGDETAAYTLVWEPSERLAVDLFKISAVTGETLPLSPLQETDTAFKRINASIGPLHFGTFGGVALKFLWFVLGLSLAVITAFGTMMWIERRQHGNVGNRSDRFYNRLSKLNVGVCSGLAVATAGLFLHNVIYWGDEAGRGLSIAWAYLGAWGLAIAYAFFRNGIYKANRELIAITGVLLILAALLNQVMTELPAGGMGHHTRTLITDLTLITFGVSAVVVAKALPQKRKDKVRIQDKRQVQPSKRSVSVPAE